MIPNGTIEVLENITNHLDRRKDAQDGDYDFYEEKPPFPCALRPLAFPAPRLVEGHVSEEEFYRWLSLLEEVLVGNEEFEEERLSYLINYDEVIQAVLARRAEPEAEAEEPAPAARPVKIPPTRENPLSTPIVYPDPPFPYSERWSLRADELEDRWD